MISHGRDDDSMSSWVSLTKAAKTTGINRSNIFRAVQNGRIPSRYKDGHVYCYLPTLTEWEGGKPGPDEICLPTSMVGEFKIYKDELERNHSDVKFQLVPIKNHLAIVATVYDGTTITQLPPKKICKLS